mmetsp:Transcript_19192/g.53317  ORF Transcript_19192/g.53317 Transcript_19192/m.53317 type:complete len:219 (-) Transcript_19192:820-1476(-)
MFGAYNMSTKADGGMWFGATCIELLLCIEGSGSSSFVPPFVFVLQKVMLCYASSSYVSVPMPTIDTGLLRKYVFMIPFLPGRKQLQCAIQLGGRQLGDHHGRAVPLAMTVEDEGRDRLHAELPAHELSGRTGRLGLGKHEIVIGVGSRHACVLGTHLLALLAKPGAHEDRARAILLHDIGFDAVHAVADLEDVGIVGCGRRRRLWQADCLRFGGSRRG